VPPTTGEPLLSPAAGAAPLVARAGSVFSAPSRLFRSFGDDAPWAGALVLSVAVGILVIVLLPDSVFFEAMQGSTTRRGVPVEITSTPQVVARFERIRLSMGVVASQPLLAIMLAGAASLVARRLAGWSAGFRQYFAVTTHALLISAAGALLALAVQTATGDWSWQPTLSALVPLGTEPAGRLLGSINPFTVWMLAVLGSGIAAVNHRNHGRWPAAILIAAYLALLAALALPGALAG
jgi:hypothetical protein